MTSQYVVCVVFKCMWCPVLGIPEFHQGRRACCRFLAHKVGHVNDPYYSWYKFSNSITETFYTLENLLAHVRIIFNQSTTLTICLALQFLITSHSPSLHLISRKRHDFPLFPTSINTSPYRPHDHSLHQTLVELGFQNTARIQFWYHTLTQVPI